MDRMKDYRKDLRQRNKVAKKRGRQQDGRTDLRKAEEEKWREKTNNREKWEKITKVAVQQSDESPVSTPQKGEKSVELRGRDQRMSTLHLPPPESLRTSSAVTALTLSSSNISQSSGMTQVVSLK